MNKAGWDSSNSHEFDQMEKQINAGKKLANALLSAPVGRVFQTEKVDMDTFEFQKLRELSQTLLSFK